MMYSLLVVIVCCVSPIVGYSSGPPPSVCVSMFPNHDGSEPNSGDSPYRVIVDRTTVKQGSTMTVTLKGFEEYKGFMVQARKLSENDAIGTFIQEGQKYLSCGRQSDNCVTHGNPLPKSNVTMEWRAPTDYEGPIILKATFVKNYSTFWLDVDSESVEVVKELSFPIDQQPTKTTTTKPKQNAAQVAEFYSVCGTSHGCFGNGECIENKNCRMAAVYQKRADGKYDFELTAEAPGYVAVGFSKDAVMGDDAAVNCVNDGGEIKAHKSYNDGKNNIRLDTQTGLSDVSGSYTDGVLSCKFVLDPKMELPDETFNIDEENYHMLIAASNENAGYHDLGRSASGEPINLSDASVAAAKSDVLIKVHGALMIIAWVGCASCGIVIARYMKKAWPGQQICGKDAWFQSHRLLMVTCWLATMIAFIIIFVEIKDWTSQPTNPHAYLGVIATTLCFIQPFMALFRCGPTDSKRPIFNWAHWSVGNIAHICGIIAILFAFKLTKASLPEAFFWVMIAFVVIYIISHILFSVLDWLNCKGSLVKCSPGLTEGSGEGETCKKLVLFIFEVIVWVFAAILIYLAVDRPGKEVK